MKKWNLWLLASLFVAAFTLTACSKDDDDDKKNSMSLIGTWKAWDSMDETHYQLLTFNKDKTFSLDYVNIISSQPYTYNWSGTWTEEDGNLVITATQYTEALSDQPIDIDSHLVLHYQKYANGYFIYGDGELAMDKDGKKSRTFGGVFLRDGETLDESKITIADKELIGEWETADKQWFYTFNADGTWESGHNPGWEWFISDGRFVEIEPLSLGGEEIKQFIVIRYFSRIGNGVGGRVETNCYLIQDDQLYIRGSKYVETLDDLLKTNPYTRKTE